MDANEANGDASTPAAPTSLKMDLEWMQHGQPVRVSLQVEGQGAEAQRVAAELSRAATNAMLRGLATEVARNVEDANMTLPVEAVVPTPIETAPIAPSTTLASTIASANTVTIAAVPMTASAPQLTPAQAPSPKAVPTPKTPSPMQVWFRENRTQINRIFGGLLLALALIVPLIVPAEQRRDVLIMTILFGLTGALLLFTSFLPERSEEAKATREMQQPVVQPAKRVVLTSKQAQLLRASRASKPVISAGWGLLAAIVFIATGLFAPFLLGASNADERFVIMLGFAPVTVVGFFMLVIFGRPYWAKFQSTRQQDSPPTKPTVAPSTGGAATAKRPPVSRVPQTVEYRALVPIAIVAVIVLMVAVVGLVIYATVSSAVR